MRVALHVVLTLWMLTTWCSGRALAHDPPFGTGVWKLGERIVVRTNRGFVVSDADARTFSLLCNEAIGITTTEVPAVVTRSGGGLLVGTSLALLAASEDFCSIRPVAPLDQVAVPALASDPSDGERFYASTGQSGFDNGLYLSADDGTTFVAHGRHEAERIYETLFVSEKDTRVLYASGLRVREDRMGFAWFIAESRDGGATFVEHPFALQDAEYGVRLLGLHPSDDSTVYAVAQAELGTGVPDRFLVSTDAGATFRTALSVHALRAFTIDGSGSRLWVGGRDGLQRSSDMGESFDPQNDTPTDCALFHGTRLYVCDERDGVPGLSVSEDGGESFAQLMSFRDVKTQVSCPMSADVVAACAAPWADWQRELLTQSSLDAGAIDGGPSADAGDAAHVDDRSSGSSCSASPGRSSADAGTGLALGLALGLLLRRRRMRRGAGR